MSASLEFVDTNILLYSIDHSEPHKRAQAAGLLDRLWKDRSGCLSVQVFQEFFVNATGKLARPLDAAAARQLIEDYSLWVVHAPSSASVLAAIDTHRKQQVSFWDAMILTSAQSLGAVIVWSEDLNTEQHFGALEVLTPFT